MSPTDSTTDAINSLILSLSKRREMLTNLDSAQRARLLQCLTAADDTMNLDRPQYYDRIARHAIDAASRKLDEVAKRHEHVLRENIVAPLIKHLPAAAVGWIA